VWERPEKEKLVVTLDVAHVFRVFRGPRGLLDAFDKHHRGHALTYNRVQMWRQRDQIPARWVGAVFYLIDKEGQHCADFLHDPDEFK
jgi:hypothetical protein